MGSRRVSDRRRAVGVAGVPSAESGAASMIRVIVERLAVPAHVSGYLRGYADSLEQHGAATAPGVSVGDVVSAAPVWLAAYVPDPVVSSDASVSEQRLRIGAAVDRGRFQVAGWYSDGRADATNLRSSGLQAARATIKSGAAGGIVVAEMRRLGRNSLDVFDLVQRARGEGWRLVALDCQFDSGFLAGQIATEGLAAARRLEWRRVGTKPLRNPRYAAPRAAVGAIPGDVVERIVRLRSAGSSYRAIATALNRDHAQGAPGGQWRVSTVRAALSNTRGRA